MKKVVSVTPIYNNEEYIRPHFNMLRKYVDQMVVLLGDKPFPEYEAAFDISRVHDKSEEILRSEFPEVHIYPQVCDSFGAQMLQDGMEKARLHDGDVMLKLDVDMYLTDKDFTFLLDYIQSNDFDSLLLNYQKNTFVYKKDLYHGVPCNIFPGGSDPVAINTKDNFYGDHVVWGTMGENKKNIESDDFLIHHLTGVGRANDEEMLRVEGLQGFKGWQSAPDEILKMFEVNNKK